jgi:hypothetical protein
VLRGNNFAKTETIEGIAGARGRGRSRRADAPRGDGPRHGPSEAAGEEDRPIVLRGLSWIVNHYEEGGVVLAVEITLGAAVAGPFDIDKARSNR